MADMDDDKFIVVKTLDGKSHEIWVDEDDTIEDVKEIIENNIRKHKYQCDRQLLVYKGKFLEDESTLAEIGFSKDDDFLVLMLKGQTMEPHKYYTAFSQTAVRTPVPEARPEPKIVTAVAVAPRPAELLVRLASGLAEGYDLEQIVQEFVDMTNGRANRTIIFGLLQHYTYESFKLAVASLHSTITGTPLAPAVNWAAATGPPALGAPNSSSLNRFPQVNATPLAQPVSSAAATGRPAPGPPNSSPLNLFPQDTVSRADGASPGSPNNQTIVASMLTLMLNRSQQEFLRVITELILASNRNLLGQAEEDIPHAVIFTPAEHEAIERIVALGFDQARVIEAFLACNRNEEQTVNNLLENGGNQEDN